MVYVEICARRDALIYRTKLTGIQNAESCRRWSYSGSYYDSNIKSKTGTYAVHLIFMQLPDVTWNDQEFKAFLTKMNCIMH